LRGIEKIILEAEKRWLPTLSEHCRKLFKNTFLPSHDHIHHERVWSFARSLLILLDRAGANIPESYPEQLLISVWFHDTGLTQTRGEMHGIESRHLCETFFSKDEFRDNLMGDGLNRPDDDSMEIILYAIEHHDDKSLNTSLKEFIPGSKPELLSLLSASDDLDAFGTMGIYRYAEIYLLRGIEPEQLPARVSRNVIDRFENIRRTYGKLESFISIHESRFLQVRDFYMRLAQAYASLLEKPSWEPVLIEIFRSSLKNGTNLLPADRLLPATEFETEIRDWFNLLDRESESPDHFS